MRKDARIEILIRILNSEEFSNVDGVLNLEDLIQINQTFFQCNQQNSFSLWKRNDKKLYIIFKNNAEKNTIKDVKDQL